MALIRSSLLVIWMTSAWRPGISKALITPSRAGERQHVPDLHAPREGERRQREGLQHGQGLGHDDQLAAGKAVGRDPAQRSQGEHGDLRAEPCGAEQKFRMGQAIHQPALRHVLHPGADQRDDLAADEEAEIAVPQGAKRVWKPAGRKFRGQRQAGSSPNCYRRRSHPHLPG